MFKETADIQTAALNLPVPEAHYHNVVLKPSKAQKKMVEGSRTAQSVSGKNGGLFHRQYALDYE